MSGGGCPGGGCLGGGCPDTECTDISLHWDWEGELDRQFICLYSKLAEFLEIVYDFWTSDFLF